MKNRSFKLAKSLLLSVSIFFCASLQHSASARVEAISRVVGENNSSVLLVKCSSREARERLVKQDGQWCDSQVTDLCSKRRLQLAKKVCQRSYLDKLQQVADTQSAAEQQQATNNSREQRIQELKAEQLKIQSNLADIERQRIALIEKENSLKSN